MDQSGFLSPVHSASTDPSTGFTASGWSGVHDLLTKSGFEVTVLQHPTFSLEGDVVATRRAIEADDKAVILVGHPWEVDALSGPISEPAWRVRPSWYLVATDDRMIPPPAQRAMAERAGATTVEVAGSHSVYVSQPEAVANLIAKAATNAVPAAV